MAASTVPAAKAYLVAGIEAAIDDPEVLVSYGDPGPNVPEDAISIGNVERQVTSYALVGDGRTGSLREEYTIEVVVSCFRGGDEKQSLDARLWEIVNIVESVVRSDMSLGDAVLKATPAAFAATDDWDPEHKGYSFTAIGHIHCQAVI